MGKVEPCSDRTRIPAPRTGPAAACVALVVLVLSAAPGVEEPFDAELRAAARDALRPGGELPVGIWDACRSLPTMREMLAALPDADANQRRGFHARQELNGSWAPFDDRVVAPDAEPVLAVARDRRAMRILTTAFATTAYLGAGYDHRTPSRYRDHVLEALNFVLAQQRPDGAFHDDLPVHAWCQVAVAEAFAMTDDPRLEPKVSAGLEHLSATGARDAEGRLCGWGTGRPDDAGWVATLPTCLGVMALKSTEASGRARAGELLEEVRAWFDHVFHAANPDLLGYRPDQIGIFPQRATVDGTRTEGTGDQSAALAIAVFLGHRGGNDPVLRALGNAALAEVVAEAASDAYRQDHAYLATLGLFQLGGEHWELGSRAACFQDVDLAEGPTFDRYTPSPAHRRIWGASIELATAMTVLKQEIHYRYLPTTAQPPVGTEP